jgi:hypothetical protein
MSKEKEIMIDLGNEESNKSTKSLLRDILDGSILTREVFISHLGYFLFLTLIGIFYIGNRYHAEKVIRGIMDVDKQVKDIRAEAVLTQSELMQWKNQSNVYRLVTKHELGLKPLVKPPKQLLIDE